MNYKIGQLKMFYPKSPFLHEPLVESEILKRNPSLVKELLEWLCQTPTTTTYRVNLMKSNTQKFRKRLETALAKKYENPPKVFEIANIPEILCIGAAEGKIPQQNNEQKEVIIDSCCGAALLRGAQIYAPGVLAMESGTKKQESVQVYADLSGQCKKGTNTRYNSENKVFIGEGVVRMQRHQLFSEQAVKAGVAVEMQWTISDVPSIGDLGCKSALLQNFPSIVCVRLLQPHIGEHILDMCAAPGNKTTHIVEMMRDDGVVIALDKTESKIKYIREKQSKYGYRSICAFAYDSTKSYNALAGEHAKVNGPLSNLSPPFFANSFHRILLDAPCSALGNRPLLTSSMTTKMLQSYPHVQRKLLENAVPLLRRNGVLVYSTCTITEAENECMVAWALKKFPQLKLIDATPKYGGPGLPNCGLNDEERHMVQRFGPRDSNFDKTIDTVGFFIAKFQKI